MSNQIITNTSLTLHKDEELVISKRKKSHKPGFIMIGNGNTNKHGITSIDLLHEIANMSSNEKYAFFLIKDNIVFDPYDECFIYQVRVNLTTDTDKSKFSRGYTSLRKKELLKRISKGTYMINPNALVPSDYHKELKVWEAK